MIALRQDGGLITAACSGDCVPPVGTPVRATSFAGRSVAEEALLVCPDTDNDPRVDPAACRALNVRSMIAAPISSDGRIVGVLAVFGSTPGEEIEDSAKLARTLAAIAGEILRTPPPTVSAPPSETPVIAPPAEAAEPSGAESTAETTVIRTLPYFDEPQTPETAVDSIAIENAPPVANPEVPTVPEIQIAPDITTLPLHTETKEDHDEPLLLASFALQEESPHRRTWLKLTLVLLVVAALAAGQWKFRGKIIGAIRSRLAPATNTVQPTAPVAVPQPVVTQPAPAGEPQGVAPEASTPQTEASPAGRSTPAAGNMSKPANAAKDAANASPAEIRPPKLLSRVEPVSPPELKAESTVALNATILSDGSIGKVTVVSGEPALRQAAIAAVKRWKYRPAYQGRQPVAVTVPIEVTFQAR
jgi:protein TonB